MRRWLRLAVIAAVVAFGATRRQKVGTFLGIPYDWRWPTPAVIRQRFSNPNDDRIFTPKVFGWGWSIDISGLLHRLG